MRLSFTRYLMGASAILVAASGILTLHLTSRPSAPLSRIDGVRVLAIIVDGFDAPEYREVSAILESQGALVATASFALDEVVGERGTVKPDFALGDVDLTQYDAVLIPGGYHIRDNVREHPMREALYELLRRADGERKLIAAICRAPSVLGDAGAINGKRVTGYDLDELEAFGALAVSKAVAEDGNLITASGPAAAGEFAERLVERLAQSA